MTVSSPPRPQIQTPSPRLAARIARAPLARSSFGLTASRAISGTLVMVSSVLVARAGGASALGIFGLAVTIGGYAITFADVGVSQYLLPELGRTPRRRWPVLRAEAARFAVRSTLPLVVLYALAVSLLAHGGERRALLAVTGWWLLVRTSGYLRPFFIAAERVGTEAVATIAEGALALATVAAFLRVSHSPALATLGLAVGAAAGLAIRLRGLRTLGVRGGRAGRRGSALALASAPFAAFTILTAIYLRIDVVLLSILRTPREVGLYQPPVRLVTALLILPDVLAAVLLGRATRPRQLRSTTLRQEQLLALGVPLGLLMVGVCAVAGKFILGVTYGPDFRPAWPALTLLTATVPLSLLAAMNGTALTARGMQWTRVACLSLASVCAVGLAIPAIVRFGYTGAAAVSVVNELVLVLAYGFALARRCGRDALVLPRARFRGVAGADPGYAVSRSASA